MTQDNLADLVCFGEGHGKFRYCSCMRWRLRSAAFAASVKDERVEALSGFVRAGVPIGVLAYDESVAIAWCSIAPRETYAGLERYRALPRIDDQPVWSIVCFFVDRRFRRQGVTTRLLSAAVSYAGSQGAVIIEGYPVDPGSPSYTYMGAPSAFRAAGFRDVTPPGQTRRVVRYHVGEV